MKNKLPAEMAGQTCRPARRPVIYAFTLIEVMVVVTLLALIIFALMTVFGTTQNAFRASVTQTDVLEGGRATMDLIANDLKPMSPAALALSPANYLNSGNFYASIKSGFIQSLPASSASRTNVIEDVFFLTQENQAWTGIGYFVRTNEPYHAGDLGFGSVGSLYRYEETARNPAGLYIDFTNACFGAPASNTVSRILDGVMSFKIRAYDTNGDWIVTSNLNGNVFAITNFPADNNWGEVERYDFYSNALPASIEVELAILEDRALKRVESLPTSGLQDGYLSNHVGQVHVFRQRILIPNADQ